jgi:VWFA-related protein
VKITVLSMTSFRGLFSASSSALLLLASAPLCIAQSSQPAQTGNSAQIPAETLHTGTQLVIVDVVVEDRSGHAIHGLTRDNFVLAEQKTPQTIRNFEEHSATAGQKPGPPIPPMPPGTFTDYTPVARDSTLNVLLIDALNTPMKDQIFVRQQLLDYIKHEKPGINVAIFGLTNRLVMLQGFTSDPAVLRAAVEHHVNSKASSLLDDPVGGGNGAESLSDAMQDAAPATGSTAAFAQALASVQQFEAEQESIQMQMRTQYTLDAFNALAHYLSNFPGRKNLIWFSGSFPLQIEPDPTLNDPFAVMADSNEEFRETTNLLTMTQTAVYPVDARGLMTAPMFDVSNSGKNYARGNPAAFMKDAQKFSQSQADEHMTMEAMANDTGGHAFYNTNALADTVAKAIDAGANYYTLTYNPTDHNRNGGYRNIHVELSGSGVAQGLTLAYRHGYYADDPQQPQKPKRGELPTKATPTPPTATALVDHAAEAYSQAAISRGAPAPSDILFKVRVLPLTGKNDDTLAAGNQADPNGKMKAPYRAFAVDYVALPDSFALMPQSDGRYTGAIEFSTFVYDADGNLLNVSGKTLSLSLNAELYKRFMSSPVRFQLMVSAPVKQQSFMRLIIHDVPSNHYGVVEISTAEVGHLPPLDAQNTPANGAAPNAGAAPKPTAKQ